MHRLRTSAALAALLAATAAHAQDAPAGRVESTRGPVAIRYETYRLPNGLNVILSRDTVLPVVSVNLWYHVGSANEEAGRTGFAHLFEHMMFQGSQNVGDDQHFNRIQEAGGTLNGTTNPDRTNYFETVPSNFLEMALWLESDRMGFLLPAMTQAKLDNQRDVVKNERRQNYENQPYGLAYETIMAAVYPPGHPYHHITIGSQQDLSAASMEDVQSFFRKYYAPNNASLAIVGDFEPAEARRLVAKYFGSIPPGPPIQRPQPREVRLDAPKHLVLEDRVQLPRLYMVWPTPAFYAPGDAELDVIASVLSDGKNSRLYQRLVYQEQIAQSVSAYQSSLKLGSTFNVMVQAKPGVDLDRVQQIVQEEIERLRREPPTEREVRRSLNNIEANFVRGMESTAARSNQLNSYYVFTGDPGYFDEDLDRYRKVTPQSALDTARRYLGEGRVVLSVVPQGKTDLQATR